MDMQTRFGFIIINNVVLYTLLVFVMHYHILALLKPKTIVFYNYFCKFISVWMSHLILNWKSFVVCFNAILLKVKVYGLFVFLFVHVSCYIRNSVCQIFI